MERPLGALGHHGAAAYEVDREVTVTGVVTDWRWTNPHTWIYLAVPAAGGAAEAWDGEGPPLTWAAARGWSETTFRVGERVSLLLYPARSGARTGLVKRITRANGEVLVVSRPWLDR